LHLVVGAGEFIGDSVARTLAEEVPVIALNADADDETFADAMTSVDIVHFCAQVWSPARRLRFKKEMPSLLQRAVQAARRAGVRRFVHLSTADVYGPDHYVRINEKAKLRPVHVYERLKLLEERWIRSAAEDLEVVVVRPARLVGVGEDWMLPRLMRSLGEGRLWLPGGGRSGQTFIDIADVARACLAAADRGRPGQAYLAAGFDSNWRALLELAARVIGIRSRIRTLPYDLAYLAALAEETVAATGAPVWPGIYAVDVMGKPHLYDDSRTRRELTWSPSVGSFEQVMPQMASWLAGLAGAVSAPNPAAG
jgi:nucleoside-diphosphate-sugar epimerase